MRGPGWMALGFWGCGDGSAPCPEAADPALDVALGETVEDGWSELGEPRLEFGPQGGQHLWLAVRVEDAGMAPRPLDIALSAFELRDGEDVDVGGFRRWFDDPRSAGATATWDLFDLQLVVSPWNPDWDRRLTLDVADDCGRRGHVEIELVGGVP